MSISPLTNQKINQKNPKKLPKQKKILTNKIKPPKNQTTTEKQKKSAQTNTPKELIIL